MRIRTGAVLLVIALLGGLRLVAASDGALTGFDDLLARSGGTREAEGPLSPAGDWLYAQRAGQQGVVSAGAYQRALAQAARIKAMTARVAPDLADVPWTRLGPTNIGGRVVEIALDPTPADTVYAATASGGVWKSTDGAVTWTYSWPPDITQAMGAIAVASDGTIYAGTGEANPGGGSVVWGGTGLYRSKDGGASWQPIGLPTSGAIGRIVVDPADPKRVFVASAGDLFVPGGERGVYRSVDGGDSWQRVLAGENATTGAIDIAIDPKNPSNLLAAMWDHVRLPTHRMYAGVGSGVYRSTDGGGTWTEIVLPANVQPKDVGRIGVAFAPSNPSRAYAIVASRANGDGVGLWSSDNGGATFTKTGTDTGSLSQSSYGWWFGKLWVDPANQERVFVAGLELVESTDGGDSFTAHGVSTAGVLTGVVHHTMPHADQHGMVFDPQHEGRVYLANDGGVYRSEANGRIGTWVGSVSQGWTQHYSVDVNELAPDQVISGLQDNMCQRSVPANSPATPTTWTKIGICGDGLQTLINPADPTWTYACAQYGACGVQRAGVPDPRRPGQLVGAKPPGQRYGWLTPLEFDPTNPAVMYFGSNVVSRSTDNGITFQAISGDLTTQPQQHDPNPGYRIYGTITSLAAAKSNPNVIYVGTDDGLLWRTTDLGGTWSRLEDPDDPSTPEDENDLPGTWVTRVAVDPTNADVAYATFSGFRNADSTPHVVKTTDGGQSWSNISGNLPAAPVNEVIVLPGNRLAVASDVGIFLTTDGGATWLTVGSDLPVVPVLDLRYHQGTNSITAATFGHGVQRITLP
jgi:photosystem II stability/assembly factor-like uncharacterized protein